MKKVAGGAVLDGLNERHRECDEVRTNFQELFNFFNIFFNTNPSHPLTSPNTGTRLPIPLLAPLTLHPIVTSPLLPPLLPAAKMDPSILTSLTTDFSLPPKPSPPSPNFLTSLNSLPPPSFSAALVAPAPHLSRAAVTPAAPEVDEKCRGDYKCGRCKCLWRSEGID